MSEPSILELLRQRLVRALAALTTGLADLVLPAAAQAPGDLRRMRRIYAERHEALCHAARARLAGALDILPSHSGLHTIGWLRGDLSERRVVAAAEQRQITVSPIERFAIAPIEARGLVLGFGGVTPAQIDAGVKVLAEVLEQQSRA